MFADLAGAVFLVTAGPPARSDAREEEPQAGLPGQFSRAQALSLDGLPTLSASSVGDVSDGE